jgi:hypothetical protein
METRIIGSKSLQGLNEKIEKYYNEGYEVVGSHQVVEVHHQNRFRGTQHVDTIVEHEYSITLVRQKPKNVIEVDISYYHPNDDETIKVYDEEGMLEEFNYKLKQIMK